MIVGVVGGIGAGKSTVTRMLAELGADTVEADALAHEALESPHVRQTLLEWIGKDAMGRDGKVDRKVLAGLVFSSPEKLKKLESLVHPEVLRQIEEKVKSHEKQSGQGGVLVLDVPLLLGSPLQDRCQEVVFVEASREARGRRVGARGWTPGELERRESLQPPAEEKLMRADHVIDNSGSLEETRRQVTSLYALWTRSSCERKERKEGKA